MFELPRPGVYAIRTSDAEQFCANQVSQWFREQHLREFKAFLWFTAKPLNELRDFIQPFLNKRRSRLKGFDVVSIRPALKSKNNRLGIKDLCQSLETLCVLDPALVFLEHAEIWLDPADEPLEQRNPQRQLEILHKWAVHANACIVTPLTDTLAPWTVFTDGFCDTDLDGFVQFKPWWPTAWGIRGHLWHDEQTIQQAARHSVLRTADYPKLGDLAQAVYTRRFADTPYDVIHVEANIGHLSSQDAATLVRLGADSVIESTNHIEECFGVDADKISVFPRTKISKAQEQTFARDLHEIFGPGMLRLLHSSDFARNGQMMLKLAKRWGIYTIVTRLSLLPHITAQTAVRLADWGPAAATFTATREAFYALKVWTKPPTEGELDQWLEVCFTESLGTLFSGYIHYDDYDAQSQLLSDLHEELEPLSLDSLMEVQLSIPSHLSEVWKDKEENTQFHRPWLNRLKRLIEVDGS